MHERVNNPCICGLPERSRTTCQNASVLVSETGMVSIARCSWVLSWVCLPLVTGPYKTFCGPARGIWTMLRSPPGTLTRSLAPAQLHSTPFHSPPLPQEPCPWRTPPRINAERFFGRVDALSFSFRGKES